MRKSFIILIISMMTGNLIHAQNKPLTQTYRNPIDIPIFLSGTFAELRSNHFHSGIDIRTASKSGLKVYAIENGFVSRIAVSPGGFGKALYIEHPDGHTSVYAHLQQFEGEIATYLKQQQYKQESFEVNLYLEKGAIQVKRGQIVALSGNSGSSEGPHLHFEIRDTKTQEVLNPLSFGIKVQDNIRPAITRLAIYPIGIESYANNSNKRSILSLTGIGEKEIPKQPVIIEAEGEIAFGITTSDQLNGVPNNNGIYSITFNVDNKVVFKFVADRFSFDETRYINSMIDYDFLQNNKSRVIRTEIDPFNKLSMYENLVNDGILKVEQGKAYQAEFIIKDFQGNISRLPFTVKGVKSKETVITKNDTTSTRIIAGKAFEINKKDYFIHFEPGSFYRNQLLACKTRSEKGFLSQTISIGSKNIPVHQRFKIGIKPDNTKISNDKLLIVSIEKGEKPTALGGKIENGFIVASIRNLGEFALMCDTVQPLIKPVNFTKGASVQGLKKMQIIIQDEFSGISSYRGTLNGKWILMDYDAKNDLLTYDFDDKIVKGKNKLVVKVIDNCGNSKVFISEVSY
jgi:hypothetical protein